MYNINLAYNNCNMTIAIVWLLLLLYILECWDLYTKSDFVYLKSVSLLQCIYF